MKFFKSCHWEAITLTCLILTVASTPAQTDVGQPSSTGTERTCESLRREMSLLFEQVYDKMPSLLNMMVDTARDLNIGKRADLGVEVMKRMIVNTFTSFLPPCAHHPPMRQQGMQIKSASPDGFFSKLQPSLSPSSRFYTKLNNRKRIQDSAVGKVRRRRSGGSYDAKIGSDFLQIGEAAIPLELFQAQDKGNEEEEKKSNYLGVICLESACAKENKPMRH